ncbi:MAG: hypothetical protein J5715_01360 [Clostridiales bacterium]|nr:hypothetical protein [Clostridiales bacterium]
MRNDERKMVALLSEVTRVCEKKGLAYYVIEQELLSSAREKRLYEAEADICMSYQDFKKIRRTLRRRKDRTIECLGNNINMPGVFFRYVTDNSFLYVQKYHKVRKAHGIAINIHILRNTGDESKELNECEEIMSSLIDGCQERTQDLDQLKKHPFCFKRRMKKLLKKAALTDMDEESVLHIPGTKPMVFPAGFWKQKITISIGKGVFDTTANIDQYLTMRYGDDYADARMVSLLTNYQVLSAYNIRYDKVVGKVDRYLDEDPIYRDARCRFTKFYNEEYIGLLEKEADDWEVLFFVGERVRLFKKYSAERDKIKRFLNEGRSDEAFMILEEYFTLFKSYLKKGKVLYFDDEFWDICSNLWKESGYEELVEEAEELMKSSKVIPVDGSLVEESLGDRPCDETVRMRKI